MKNLNEYKNAFDSEEPLEGHQIRFERKLQDALHHKTSLANQWLKIAASIIVLLGIGGGYLFLQEKRGSDQTAEQVKTENTESIELEEAKYYYQKQFNKQFAAIANTYNDEESKLMIQQSQLLVSDLEKEYEKLDSELSQTGDYRVATAMILNYKSRISILETLIKNLEYVSLQKNKQHEKINA